MAPSTRTKCQTGAHSGQPVFAAEDGCAPCACWCSFSSRVAHFNSFALKGTV